MVNLTDQPKAYKKFIVKIYIHYKALFVNFESRPLVLLKHNLQQNLRKVQNHTPCT